MIGPTIASGVILNQNILHEYMALSDATMFSSSSISYVLNFRYKPIHLAYAQPCQWTCTELTGYGLFLQTVLLYFLSVSHSINGCIVP